MELTDPTESPLIGGGGDDTAEKNAELVMDAVREARLSLLPVVINYLTKLLETETVPLGVQLLGIHPYEFLRLDLKVLLSSPCLFATL